MLELRLRVRLHCRLVPRIATQSMPLLELLRKVARAFAPPERGGRHTTPSLAAVPQLLHALDANLAQSAIHLPLLVR